jgi:hypothetical protein
MHLSQGCIVQGPALHRTCRATFTDRSTVCRTELQTFRMRWVNTQACSNILIGLRYRRTIGDGRKGVKKDAN